MDLFTSSDYKAYLSKLVEGSSWGTISRLADAAGCQRSYFSKVLKGSIHLTTDHASGLCDYLKFSNEEADYFMALVELGRAATPAYRRRIHSKLKMLRDEHENLTMRLKRPAARLGEKEMLYYSAWYYSAIHILVSIPEFQSVEAIAKRLELNTSIMADFTSADPRCFHLMTPGGSWDDAVSLRLTTRASARFQAFSLVWPDHGTKILLGSLFSRA